MSYKLKDYANAVCPGPHSGLKFEWLIIDLESKFRGGNFLLLLMWIKKLLNLIENMLRKRDYSKKQWVDPLLQGRAPFHYKKSRHRLVGIPKINAFENSSCGLFERFPCSSPILTWKPGSGSKTQKAHKCIKQPELLIVLTE